VEVARVSARERLARALGPDLLELLDEYVDQRVQAALAAREAERRWLTVAEAAQYLGVSTKAIYHRVAGGTVPYTRHGRRVLIDRVAYDRMLAERVRTPK
jgi:excisionase family DNA binding protein